MASVLCIFKSAVDPLQPSESDNSPTINNQLNLLDMNTNTSNSLMFLILGVLAGAMLIVMIFLVAICLLRQRREKLRLMAQVESGDKGEDCLSLSLYFLTRKILYDKELGSITSKRARFSF